MFKHCMPFVLFLTACVAAAQSSPGDATSHRALLAAIQPRLLKLWNLRPEKQQPIVIVQPSNNHNNNDESDRHHHHHRRPYYDYYPYPYPAPPPPPQRPPFSFPGLNDYLNGSGASIVIINPNNAQNLNFSTAAPAAAAADGAAGGRNAAFRRASIPIVDLLQGSILDDDTEVINAAENEPEPAPVPSVISTPYAQYGGEERDDEAAEDELALLERQATRGLSTKHLLSFLMQDKRRRRVQEAIAGIYLRNYNQNRK